MAEARGGGGLANTGSSNGSVRLMTACPGRDIEKRKERSWDVWIVPLWGHTITALTNHLFTIWETYRLDKSLTELEKSRRYCRFTDLHFYSKNHIRGIGKSLLKTSTFIYVSIVYLLRTALFIFIVFLRHALTALGFGRSLPFCPKKWSVLLYESKRIFVALLGKHPFIVINTR
jgi:hypothetical protein